LSAAQRAAEDGGREISRNSAEGRDVRRHDMVEGVKKIGVVGAGTMGAGVAQVFAAAGYPVRLRDIAEAPLGRGMGAIKKSLERLVGRGKLTPQDRDATLERIAPTTKIEDLADCDVVVEAVLERFDLKKEVIGQLDALCRADAILATNTSSISVTRIASTSKIPGRVIGMHYFNPVPMMQLVEIIRALQTTDETCNKIIALTEAIGKKARMTKDSYGFIVNRVLIPMINEAINCVHEGLASPEDVDQMMKLGANHPMGPLSLADLIGLDIVLDIMESLYNGFEDSKYRPSPLLKQMCDAGYLGRKTGKGFFAYEAAA
jgi:3-hydroxybutyryl-CoA dehydrogenase